MGIQRFYCQCFVPRQIYRMLTYNLTDACGCEPVDTPTRCRFCRNRFNICKTEIVRHRDVECPECRPNNGSKNGSSSEGRSTTSGSSSARSSGFRDSQNKPISDTKINIARLFAGPAYRKQFDDATGWNDRQRSRRDGGRSERRSSGTSRRSRSSGSYASLSRRYEDTDQDAEGTIDSQEHDEEDPGNQILEPVNPPAQYRPSANVQRLEPVDPHRRSSTYDQCR